MNDGGLLHAWATGPFIIVAADASGDLLPP